MGALAEPQNPTEEPPPPSVIEAAGGPLGMAETALPGLAFVVAYTVTGQDTNLSAYVALGLAAALAAARLARRETPRHALSGLFGVALAAFVATAAARPRTSSCPG